MDQLIPIVIFAALAFGKWLFDRAMNAEDEPRETPPPVRRPRPVNPPRGNAGNPSEESDEEKMRRFMEALGLPPESAPPRPARRTEPPASTPRRPAPIQRTPKLPPSPPIVNAPAQTARRRMGGGGAPVAPQPAAPPAVPATMAAPASPVSESAPAMEIAAVTQAVNVESEQLFQVSRPASSRNRPSQTKRPSQTERGNELGESLKDQLRTPAALRKAILLKEILGTPKGLQSAATSTNFSPL